MGINTRIGKVADSTYSAPTTSGASITLTFTTNTPTATTAQTIADGSSPTVVETGQFMQNTNTQLTNVIADIAALKAAIGQSATDNAAMLAQLNAGE